MDRFLLFILDSSSESMSLFLTPTQEKRRKKRTKQLSVQILKKAKANKFKQRLQFLVGFHSVTKGPRETSKIMFVSKKVAQYWGKKLIFPDTFHPESQGGAR